MSDQPEKIEQFSAITGTDSERAKFFLESSAWNVEVAVSRYYEADGDASDNDADVQFVDDSPSPRRGGVPTEPNLTGTPTQQQQTPSTRRSTKPAGGADNFATLGSLASAGGTSSDEDEGQAYYAGGSGNSGQQVLGPPKKKKDIVTDMFRSVQEHGVEVLDPSMAGSSTSRAFRGTGYKLGQSSDDSVAVPGEKDPSPPRQVTLKFWQNGFSVNDGELRPYTDPANQDFLNSIRRGEIPVELRQGSTEIHLAMQDHRMEEFKPPDRKKPVKAFQGHGYTLGSPAPVMVGACTDEDKPANEAKAKENLKLDSSKPTTSLQIRLADGSRLVGQFNHEHTVQDVRTYITNARPQYQTQPFNLLSTYPSKTLDDSQSLKDAGLLNASIMQKLI